MLLLLLPSANILLPGLAVGRRYETSQGQSPPTRVCSQFTSMAMLGPANGIPSLRPCAAVRMATTLACRRRPSRASAAAVSSLKLPGVLTRYNSPRVHQGFAWRRNGVCWICNGWREQTFYYHPYLSGPLPHGDLELCVSFDSERCAGHSTRGGGGASGCDVGGIPAKMRAGGDLSTEVDTWSVHRMRNGLMPVDSSANDGQASVTPFAIQALAGDSGANLNVTKVASRVRQRRLSMRDPFEITLMVPPGRLQFTFLVGRKDGEKQEIFARDQSTEVSTRRCRADGRPRAPIVNFVDVLPLDAGSDEEGGGNGRRASVRPDQKGGQSAKATPWSIADSCFATFVQVRADSTALRACSDRYLLAWPAHAIPRRRTRQRSFHKRSRQTGRMPSASSNRSRWFPPFTKRCLSTGR